MTRMWPRPFAGTNAVAFVAVLQARTMSASNLNLDGSHIGSGQTLQSIATDCLWLARKR